MTFPNLEIKNVSRAFGGVNAVDGVSLSLGAGEILALLGASGSGKSTLLRMIAGLENIDHGEVFSEGERVASASFSVSPEKRGLGMVFQDYALFPHLTAAANVMFGLKGATKPQAREIAASWLDKVGLASRAEYYPHQLSGGEQQRVALARALAPNPKAVLMDEPFSGLDPFLRADLQSLTLESLRLAGVAALIVSHDTDEALAIADQVAIMDKGRILQAGSPRAVYEAPVSLQVARALGPIWTFPCKGENGKAETPFGTYSTSLSGDILLVARPEATHVSPNHDGEFIVTDSRGVGRLVTLTLMSANTRIQALVEANVEPSTGVKMRAHVAQKDAFLFQATNVPAR